MFEKVRKDIAKYGWSSVGVFPSEDNPVSPFTYSIGFLEHDHPELIVSGLPPTTAHQIIAGLYHRVKDGARFEAGQLDTEVLEGFEVKFQALPPDGRPLNMTRRFYGRDEVPALQVLWPDREGLFPDDPGCDPRMAVRQDLSFVRDEDD